MPQWFVYVLRCRNGTLYTGIATDVKRRLAEHESSTGRGARYLRGRNPLELLVARPAGSRATALRVEHRVKRLPRARKEELVKRAVLLDRLVEAETERASPNVANARCAQATATAKAAKRTAARPRERTP